MSNQDKDYYFLIYLKIPSKEIPTEEIKFLSPKDNAPKCIYNKEENGSLIKVFKYSGIIKDQSFLFSFGKNEYKLIIEHPKEKTFLFDIILQEKKIIFFQKFNKISLEMLKKQIFSMML